MKSITKRLIAVGVCLAMMMCMYPLTASAQTLKGDVNYDGTVDMLDALIMYNHLAGVATVSAEDEAVGDVSGDNRIRLQDVTYIFYKALHLVSDLEPNPRPDPKPVAPMIREGITDESVYMNDIRVKNHTTGKVFTARTKADLQMAVAEIVRYEMGMSTFGEKNNEAWKAMAVAAYTELAHYCYGGYTYSIWMGADIDLSDPTDKRIYDAVGEVLGIKIAYNDPSRSAFEQLCEIFYGASNAGVTCSTLNAWGYQDLEYIPVVESKYDNADWIAYCSGGIDAFEHTFTISISELKECIAEEMDVAVSKVGYDKKDGEYSLYATKTDGPYWAKSNFYYTSSSGKKVYLSGVDLYFAINNCHPTIHCHSHALTVVGEKNGKLTVTVRGNGNGVGMSQYGAAGYANLAGWTYDRILAHYYGITPDTAWGLVGPKW